MSAPIKGHNRAALYAPEASARALAACSRYADQIGLRVVTVVDEDIPGSTPLAGKGLNRLLVRLAAGEFELIVVHTGEGRLVTLQAGIDEKAQSQPDPVRCAIYMNSVSPSQTTSYPLAELKGLGVTVHTIAGPINPDAA